MSEPMLSAETELPSFDEMDALFARCDVQHSPADLQGWLVGQCAAANKQPDPTRWLGYAIDYIQADTPLSAADKQLLLTVYTVTCAELATDEYKLSLLLPDDDTDLATRANQLRQWCHGFTIGFGAMMEPANKQSLRYSEEAKEAWQDIVQLVLMDELHEASEHLEEEERAYTDLCHHLCLAVLVIYTETHSNHGGPTDVH
jgi:uncharacterized protein YgfB (UPF0149 family)